MQITIWRLSFEKFGEKSYINSPLRLDGARNISIGNRVYVGYKTWLAALPLTGADECSLVIGDECAVGNFNHIYCTKHIVLENGVLTADKVYISDNLHGYEDVHIHIKDQPIIQHGEVVIGEGSWLGENVCVLGAKIGKHCVIGANSVVTKDIPDYCVAVGAPARIIERFDIEKNEWIKENSLQNGGVKSVYRYLSYPWRKIQYRKVTLSTYINKVNSITPKYVECGERVCIGFNARIEGISHYNNITYTPRIVLEDGVSIQQNIHLTCANSIVIGKNTAIAANVTITDIHHPYTNIDIPIEQQDIEVYSVEIGADCKICNNAVILPGVKIGKHVTVGANCVVNRNLPDYCVAVGIPVKIVKRYDFKKQAWRKTNPQGEFID